MTMESEFKELNKKEKLFKRLAKLFMLQNFDHYGELVDEATKKNVTPNSLLKEGSGDEHEVRVLLMATCYPIVDFVEYQKDHYINDMRIQKHVEELRGRIFDEIVALATIIDKGNEGGNALIEKNNELIIGGIARKLF